MTMQERLEDILNRVEKAALRAGRKREEIALMAVSKFHGADAARAALEAGVSLFGESRVQEAQAKFPSLKETYALELHMIGGLQRNKAKAALALFDCIQSLDRDDLVTTLGNLAKNREKPLAVMLELHTGEESKSGYPGFDALCRAAERALSFPGLRLSGLMTIAPYTRDTALVRTSFQTLARAREKLRARFPEADLSCLSMGMTNDFEIAIEEGSTMVRIGTALFGERA